MASNDDTSKLLSELNLQLDSPGNSTKNDTSTFSFSSSTLMSQVLSPETARRLYEVTDAVGSGPKKQPNASAVKKFTFHEEESKKNGSNSHSQFTSSMAASQEVLQSLSSAVSSIPQAQAMISTSPGNRTQPINRSLDMDLSMNISSINNTYLSVPDDAELDAALQTDPCVICYGAKVVLRSEKGMYLGLGSNTKACSGDLGDISTVSPSSLYVHAEANPLEPGSSFIVVNADVRSKTGPIKFGDNIALLSHPVGRYLGISQKKDDSRHCLVGLKRKAIGRSETFTVIEIPADNVERMNERSQRLAASREKAKKLGRKQPDGNVPVSVRSSDNIALLSAFCDRLLLCSEITDSLVDVATTFDVSMPILPSCSWSIVKSPCPYLAKWSRERVLLNGLQPSSTEKVNTKSSALLSLSQQESLLVDDILYAMHGIQGEIVRFDFVGDSDIKPNVVPNKNRVWYVKAPWLDPALAHLARRITPIATYYGAATHFVNQHRRAEHGRVVHALAAAMQLILSEYELLVAQLEHQHETNQLSLQKLWFYIQPSLQTMEILATVTESCQSSKGGILLNVLNQLASSTSDQKSLAVYRHLLQQAAVPYLEMLELWIYHGVIRDPFQEFIINVDEEESKRTLNDDFNARYWDSRYTIRTSNNLKSPEDVSPVPFFLKRVAVKILTTGKYLNVVRECGRWVSSSFAGKIPYTHEDHVYDEIVSRAHDFASQTLLNLLLQEEKLIPRLRSLKHYFLLDQGDFFVHFMDIAGSELKNPASELAITRLQSLLEMCLRIRNVDDPFQEDLACELVPYSLIEHVEAIHDRSEHVYGGRFPSSDAVPALTGIDAFTLSFKVKWPLSLVLSKQALTKYQLIFRHLFFCKYVEKQLCSAWLAHQTTKELDLRSVMGPDYCLRQRMLHFLQNFEYYVMFEVLEPRWHELEQKLAKVKTVDELMKHHSEFLDTCLRECLLTHQQLLKTFAKLMTTCLLFAQQIAKFADQLKVDEEMMKIATLNESTSNTKENSKSAMNARREQKKRRPILDSTLRRTRIKVQSEHMRRIVCTQSYRDIILRSQKRFDTMLTSFMEALLEEAARGEYHSHLTNLCTRLDFNSYYVNKTSND